MRKGDLFRRFVLTQFLLRLRGQFWCLRVICTEPGETTEYLRMVGALDEQSPSPMVLVPNYMCLRAKFIDKKQ